MKKRILILSLTIFFMLACVLACAFVLSGCFLALRVKDDNFIYKVHFGYVEVEKVRDKQASELIIPENVIYKNKTYKVEKIANNAFLKCENLRSIVISDSIIHIGRNAFDGCTSLNSVTIGNSVTNIGNYAFYGCFRLVEVYNKSSLNIVKGSTKNGGVGYYAKDIYTKEYQSKINTTGDGYVIYYDGNTKNIIQYMGSEKNLTLPYGTTEIYQHAFAFCSGLVSVTIPDSVTSIGAQAFEYCSDLVSVAIPDSVTSIGKGAFLGCDSLEYNENSNALYLGNSVKPYVILVKAKTKDITEFIIHNDTTVIYCDAFKNCKSLRSITIPDSVNSIGENAFEYCEGLVSVTIGNNVTSIGKDAFNGCMHLYEVYITDLAKWCEFSFGNSLANPLYYADNLYLNGELVTQVVIPSSVTTIGNWAFEHCDKLRSVTIGNSVTSIGKDAFNGCDDLRNITIPDSVTSIGESAFEYCECLVSVTIGNNVTSIGKDAFNGCMLYEVYITDLAKWCEISFGNSLANPLYYADNLYLNGELVTELVIPSSVTTIGDWAFVHCDKLTSVTIGNSVTSIGMAAFLDCSGLRSIIIPDSVTSIGSDAFAFCSGLVSVTIGNNVTYIGSYAFDGCTSLNSVTIGKSVTTIGGRVFSDCYNLISITIPNSVTSIGQHAFCGCKNLTIYCEAKSQPSGWDSSWNYLSHLSGVKYVPVVWGYKAEN